MRIGSFLSKNQAKDIHRGALRVLEELGVRVEHPKVRKRLTDAGGRPDEASEAVRFPATEVEKLIDAAPRRPVPEEPPRISAHVHVYESRFLEPSTGRFVPFNEGRLARYFHLARKLQSVESISMLGTPFVPRGVPARLIPLLEKLIAWKNGVLPQGAVQLSGLCEPILEMFRCHASHSGRQVGEIFRACGFLISPLRLARPECEQLLYFDQQGLRMAIGHMPVQGSSTPVSFEGAVTQALAEQMFLFLLRRSFREDAVFEVYGSISPADMRTGAACLGRPEQQRTNAAFGDLAHFYKCGCSGHTGLSDARAPSCEAGVQKASGALYTVFFTGSASISAGLLSMDEVCSPVQMVLDDDITRHLARLLSPSKEIDVDAALEEILSAGWGGSHLGTKATARNFRNELFEPRTWSRQSLNAWLGSDGGLDIDAAMEVVREAESEPMRETFITAGETRELESIIASVARRTGTDT